MENIRVRVNPENQITVRLGSENKIKVISNAGISTYGIFNNVNVSPLANKYIPVYVNNAN